MIDYYVSRYACLKAHENELGVAVRLVNPDSIFRCLDSKGRLCVRPDGVVWRFYTPDEYARYKAGLAQAYAERRD